MLRRLHAVLALAASACVSFGSVTYAQDYPARPVKLVVPWPAGGITDLSARLIATRLSARLGQSIVVENRPGATAMIGAAYVAQAPADGYTLLAASAETHGINPHTFKKLPYDPIADFVAIAPYVINPFSVVARTDFPAANIGALVELAKAAPGKYSYSSAGLGSTSQLGMEIFALQAGIKLLHVPFQGEAPAVTALMSAQTDLQMLPAGRAETLRKSGKVKVYAVTTTDRFFGLPDVPTLRESGFDKVVVANWFALAAPAKTPQAIVQRLYTEVQAIVTSPDAQAAIRAMGVDVYPPMSLAEFQQFVAGEPGRWGDVIRRANIRIEGN